VTYRIDSGPPALFGEVRVSGTRRVDPAVVRRELAFVPGDPFAQGRLDRSRADLAALGLFRTVRLDESPGRDPRVDVNVRVEEAPPREIRLGVGYDTEELVRGLASWRHYDFLGGGRQLGVSVVASFITRTIAADFLQPHFPGHTNRTRLLFAQAQEEEDAWTLDRTRFSPRLEWRAADQITGFLFHRLEYDALSSVRSAIETALPGADPGDVFLSGFGVGADWNATDDLLDPTRGFVASAQLEPVGGFLGGDVAFVRGIVEGRVYRPLVGRLLGGARMRLGTAEPTDGSPEIPLFERFYAGGLHSVRGYGRWRVGPLVDDEPIGGRSVVEAAVELRHPITREIGAAVFLDAGQVSRPSLTFPLDDLRYGAGLGVRLKTPVGPLRIDLGFPVEPPPGDPHWRAHVSLGAAF
jgi:outer membrane protein insertion porin family/translocation and assembly module TamA